MKNSLSPLIIILFLTTSSLFASSKTLVTINPCDFLFIKSVVPDYKIQSLKNVSCSPGKAATLENKPDQQTVTISTTYQYIAHCKVTMTNTKVSNKEVTFAIAQNWDGEVGIDCLSPIGCGIAGHTNNCYSETGSKHSGQLYIHGLHY